MLASEQALFILQSYNAFYVANIDCSAEQSVLGKFSIENEDAPSLDDLRALNVINTLKVLHDNNDPMVSEYAKQAELLLAYAVSGTKIATLEYVNEKQEKLIKAQNELIDAQKDCIQQLEAQNKGQIEFLKTQNEYLIEENRITNNLLDSVIAGVIAVMFVCGSAYGLLQPKDKGGFCEMTKTCQHK
jgi:hypothetical protein